GTAWNLDYLFGLVEADGTFRAFWAHTLAEEKQALLDFLAYVAERRRRHPAMHIYHYAAYERTHLLGIAARHGVGEEAVDDLLRANVLVDLYPIVKQAVRIGSRSYSLKKLEPLYMHEARAGVDNAADSITQYVKARELERSGQLQAAAEAMQQIADYNEYDCLSTLRLRDWLMGRARENQVSLAYSDELLLPVEVPDPDPVYVELAALVAGFSVGERSADETALALAAAAIDYHRRERKSFWWDHFARLTGPVEEWADTRGVFVIDSAVVERDWSTLGRARTASRTLRLSGTAAPGSGFGAAEQPFVLYDEPYPPIELSSEPGARASHSRTSVVVDEDGVLHLTERVATGAPEYSQLPIALTPGMPPSAGSQVEAISEWGRRVLNELPEMIPDAALDILRRSSPRGEIAAVAHDDFVPAMRDTLLGLDNSYLAVQGPPGTGKTYNGARVITELVVNHGWKVGVVGQSHATVENMLAAIVHAGLDPELVGKKPKAGDIRDVPWTKLGDKNSFAGRDGGFVLGGTAWTFSNANAVARGSLDLLVIDEAGQFSLASTIAAAVSARRLLLLGDPQQLPQVSQGTHPEPVDASALGWLSDGHDVLPPRLGYFLAESRRMHPAVCAPVSRLSYEGRLHSVGSDRVLDGVVPGLHPVPVDHVDNSTSSEQEAAAVLAIVREAVGRQWKSAGVTAPLDPGNVIVVAPYNAQVELLRATLDAAGFEGVPVGTVDRFQGREAAVSIVSLAASSPADVPRGLDFLLMANRLNVAISRAQWASYLVYSPALTDYLPTSPAGLAQLSAFIELVTLEP
ncbi:MAG: helicase, partial [Microbacteriaceae bacterium]|nr:helicase [Microbacteriaceae bacterium]